MEEKRKLKRRHLLGDVKIKAGAESRWLKAMLMNIHTGGIGLYVMGPLRKKQKVSVRISYINNRKTTEVEEIPGRVCWVKTLAGSTAAGIMFDVKVTKKEYPLLSKCIEFAQKG